MYKIIGADGKEYGPIPKDTLKRWIAEGRANAQSKVLPEGATEWVTVAQIPELNEPAPSGAPAAPLAPAYVPVATPQAGKDAVVGPAIGLIVTACICFLASIAGLLINVLGMSAGMMSQPGMTPEMERMMSMLGGTWGIASGILGLVVSGLILFGGIKMKSCQGYGWAMAASILAAVPCISPCCLVGLPVGIWALVVLCKPEVKALFRDA